MTISNTIWFISVSVVIFLFNIAVHAELVGYWSFDEADGVNDLSGNGHDGDVHGNPLVVEG